jgi:hypothetical protein
MQKKIGLAPLIIFLFSAQSWAQAPYRFAKVQITSTAADALTVAGGIVAGGNRFGVDPVTGNLSDPSGSTLSVVDAFSIEPGVQSASFPLLGLASQWNSAAGVFAGIDMDVLGTNYHATSLLLNLKRSGVSKFSVNPDGNLITAGTINGGNAVFGTVTGTTGNFSGLLVANAGLTVAGAVNITNGDINHNAGYFVQEGPMHTRGEFSWSNVVSPPIITFGDGNATITPTGHTVIGVDNTLTCDQCGGIQTIGGGYAGRVLVLWSRTIAFAWQLRTGGNINVTAPVLMGANSAATLIYMDGAWRLISVR